MAKVPVKGKSVKKPIPVPQGTLGKLVQKFKTKLK